MIVEVGDAQCIVNLRVDRNSFAHLCYLVTHVGGLVKSRYVRIEEKPAMFLSVLAHHKKSRIIGHDYIRSGRTSNNTWKWFKGCLGALDGTYINVHVPNKEKPKYRTRKGTTAVNVLGVCDRNMKFIYALTGWEGSAADARVLRDAIGRPNGLKIPRGCYYLCNNVYGNVEGFLTPYRRTRYHIHDWVNGSRGPQNYKEYFNSKHCKARNVIERTFGLLKRRWAILRSPSLYPLKVQNHIIMACILLHNFVRSEMPKDPLEEVDESDLENSAYMDDDFIDSVESSPAWDAWRDNLALSMYPTIENMWLECDMDTGTSNICSKEKKSDKSRRVWSVKEEEVLLQLLKDAATAGFKSENGFRCGYFVFLEDSMKKVFPGTDLRGNPHINSKIHVWKRTHGALLTMLSRSGIGWNDTDKMIDATNEAWNDFVKSDNNLRTMRYTRWPYYNDWCEIFGHDRATGEHAESFTDVVQGVLNMSETGGHDMNVGLQDLLHTFEDNGELISVIHPISISTPASKKSHSKKRKHQMQGDDTFVEAINNFTDMVKNISQE